MKDSDSQIKESFNFFFFFNIFYPSIWEFTNNLLFISQENGICAQMHSSHLAWFPKRLSCYQQFSSTAIILPVYCFLVRFLLLLSWYISKPLIYQGFAAHLIIGLYLSWITNSTAGSTWICIWTLSVRLQSNLSRFFFPHLLTVTVFIWYVINDLYNLMTCTTTALVALGLMKVNSLLHSVWQHGLVPKVMHLKVSMSGCRISFSHALVWYQNTLLRQG